MPSPKGPGGFAPKLKTRGKLPAINNPPPGGTQNLGKPSANEGGKKPGVEGAVPPPRGLGGCAPKTKNRGQSPHDGGHWGVSPAKSRLGVSS